MKILVFSELFYPHGGGAELATYLYCNGLAEKGFKVTVITRQFTGESNADSFSNGLQVYRLPFDLLYGTRYFTLANVGAITNNFVLNKIRESDVVYVPCGWYSAVVLAKTYGKPVIVHLHNYSLVCRTSLMYDFFQGKIKPSSQKSFVLHEKLMHNRGGASILASSMLNEFFGQFYYKIAKFADTLIFVSNAQRNLIASKITCIQNKSQVIQNPIPNLHYIEAKAHGIGYFGGKNYVKGFSTIMEALKALPKNTTTPAYLAMTTKNAATKELDSGIKLNLLPKVNPADIMANLSIVAVPSLCPEPSPYALIEAMLYGKLVVASAVGGISEILEGAGNGVKLIQPGNAQELVDAIVSFNGLSLQESNELGLKNRHLMHKRFDNEKSVESLMAAFSSLKPMVAVE